MIDDAALASLVCSSAVRDVVRHAATELVRLLGDGLVGVYLHGSLAMGCFTEQASDIDLLVLTDGPVEVPVLREVGELMLKASEAVPAKGFELSVVDELTTTPFLHPAPFLLHYSELFRDDFRSGAVDLSKPRTDPDLAAHFRMARTRGVRLAGKPIEGAVAPVPEEAFLDSILEDANWCLANIRRGGEAGWRRVPTYGVLNLCRVLGYLHDRTIRSKPEGGEWALNRFGEDATRVIIEALKEYRRPGSSNPVHADALVAFAIEIERSMPSRPA